MGRVMRTHPGKEYALWLDHSGNYLRFRDEWEEVYEDGVKDLDDKAEKAKKEPTEKVKKESKCPKCRALWPKNSDTCAACGHVKVKLAVEQVPGRLTELGELPKAFKDEKQSFYSELLYMAKVKNYNPNWASHKYREKFGVWPRGLSDQVKTPSIATINWIKHKQIAWAKRRSA